MNRIRLLLICLAFYLSGTAQAIHLRVVSKTPVLEAEELQSLLFSRDGLMWIGTDQGFQVYDGYGFKTYRNNAYSPGILPNNYVNAITEDQANRLWIGTRDGLTCYDRHRGSFKAYHLQGEQARSIDNLFTSSDGTVWAATNKGVSRYDAEKDDFIDINMTTAVHSFAEDAQGNIYLGTWEEGVYRLDRQSGRLVAYPSLDGRNTAQSLLMDSRGRLWIGTWENGIVRFDHPANEQDPGIHKMNEGRSDFRTFRRLVEDSISHAVWGCCIEGLTSVDLDDERLVENHPDLSFCYDLKTDGCGNLWVLTRDQGVVHLCTKQSPFQFFQPSPVGLVLPVNRIQAVYTTDNRHFWLSLQPYGLAYYDRLTGSVTYNEHIPGFGQMTGTGGIHVQTISGFMQHDSDELWMAASQGVVVWKNGSQARLLQRNSVPFIGDGDVKGFCRLHSGAVLVAMSVGVGVACSDSKGRQLVMSEQGRDFSGCDVHTIIEAHDHRIWMATNNAGIICATGDVRKPESMKYHQYAPVNGNYPLDDATAVYEDATHRLWAISNDGTLFQYDADKDCFVVMNHRYHLNANRIYSILGDDRNHLWLTTNSGLVCLKLDEGGKCLPAYYSIEDGIENIRFSPNGLSRYGDELFFGGANGFFSFKPKDMDLWQPSNVAPLIVTRLLIDDRPYEWLDSLQRQSISAVQPFYTRHITIPSDVDKFTVEFALLAYQNPRQSHYAYFLEGYDRNWHHTNADNRQATYQNLPPGTYRLQIRAIDSYGRRTDLPHSIEVSILPPWYQSWWAYLIYLVLLTAIVYSISQWYKQRVNRRARLQQRVSELLHYRELMVMRQFLDKQNGEAGREGVQKALEAEEQQHNSPDELFIQKAIDCVKQHLDDSDYDREQFASDMCVSSSTLYNKLRAMTGQNVTAFINSIRLKEACHIVRQRPDISVSELSMEVGFNTPKYFTKLFKKEFDMLPSEYIESIQSSSGKGTLS